MYILLIKGDRNNKVTFWELKKRGTSDTKIKIEPYKSSFKFVLNYYVEYTINHKYNYYKFL